MTTSGRIGRSTVSVLIADDQELLRETLADYVSRHADMVVVGQCGSGREAVSMAAALSPDVVLMDVQMPDMDGLEATEKILSMPFDTAPPLVIVLTMYDMEEYVDRALRAGVSGFLLKDALPAEVIAAIHESMGGRARYSPSVQSRIIDGYLRRRETSHNTPPDLTPREVDVLTLIARGQSNHEIAACLHISVKTVKTHITHLLRKLSARDRAQLVIAAFRAGIT
ncbi:hypothetical protein AXK56_19295 [Tsukamurella pulmonis]|uniref:DNA-binding response regulator, NarL/FixJ family, contains REC and HTH domains n=1 Tax=Tsukamurella pulmonis TaxID=47312 RepID=A0A1H1HFI2_9ACTN|nr:hypothetical protein AXK56_19295 [Tsukamurella pulmonis]SDR24175.1 DNA-binding response regulator, NarL/FixJ family, contains REC and HTH domains [Tsukamurella pulmonis]